MIHRVDVYRPTFSGGEITGYTLLFSDVPAFIQPMTSAEQLFYAQRGVENDTTIYTTQVADYHREDVLKYIDPLGVERQFHVNGVKQNLFTGLYCELNAFEWPEEAKKRLNVEAYQ
jgi:hypothetical protein